MNLDIELTLLTKINSKWITDQYVKHEIIKPTKDNMGQNEDDLGYGGHFLDTPSKAQSLKEISANLDLIKIKKFYFAKDNLKII